MASRPVEVDEDEYKKSGGEDYNSSAGGGMDMLSGFTQLGSELQNNSLSTMSYFQQLEAAKRAKIRQAEQDALAKQQMGIQNAQQNRSQNMEGIAMLGQQRQNAMGLARQRSFKNDLSAALRRA